MVEDMVGVSLGWCCFPAMYGVSKGIRGRKVDGYKTCPFDLMNSNIKGVTSCFDTDFEDFCNPKYLSLQEREGPLEKRYIIVNTKLGFKFNHESPYHANLHERQKWEEPFYFVRENFLKLQEIYQKRIDNFRTYCLLGKVLFILQLRKESEQNLLLSLSRAIERAYPRLEYDFVVLPPDQKNLEWVGK